RSTSSRSINRAGPRADTFTGLVLPLDIPTFCNAKTPVSYQLIPASQLAKADVNVEHSLSYHYSLQAELERVRRAPLLAFHQMELFLSSVIPRPILGDPAGDLGHGIARARPILKLPAFRLIPAFFNDLKVLPLSNHNTVSLSNSWLTFKSCSQFKCKSNEGRDIKCRSHSQMKGESQSRAASLQDNAVLHNTVSLSTSWLPFLSCSQFKCKSSEGRDIKCRSHSQMKREPQSRAASLQLPPTTRNGKVPKMSCGWVLQTEALGTNNNVQHRASVAMATAFPSVDTVASSIEHFNTHDTLPKLNRGVVLRQGPTCSRPKEAHYVSTLEFVVTLSHSVFLEGLYTYMFYK
ncbi:hypothetical protein J6590_008520, partial [Homalodisca vitripennis]